MAGSLHFTAAPFACLLSPKCVPRLHCSAPLGFVPSKLQSSASVSLHLTAMPKRSGSPFVPRASVDSAECIVEPATNVKFQKELNVPGCTNSLSLFGAGYREKVFAIIGVKVYAAGFYAGPSIRNILSSWEGKSSSQILEDSSIFKSIFHASAEKSLIIMLVRDVDGKTFWNALSDVISPRITSPTAEDQSALSTFQATFKDRDLKQGTYIFLTWVEPSKMLVSVSSNGFPSNYDAEIKSENVNEALYDGFFGDRPVSPTLKASVADGLKAILS